MSKVKEAVLAIFFTLFALSTFAQTGSVRGRIIDAKTKKPLEFVNVSIRTTGTQTPLTGTVSDSTGVFRINRVKNGTYMFCCGIPFFSVWKILSKVRINISFWLRIILG